VRHEFYLLLAFVLLALALVVPRLLRGEALGALLSLLSLVGIVLTGLVALLAITWLSHALHQPGGGRRGKALVLLGHLGRFLLVGFIGFVIATALVAQHGLGPRVAALAPPGVGVLSGTVGLYLHQRLGAPRFWVGFRWFGLALLGSFLGGIAGILGPEPWAVDAGILIPLVLFFAFARAGRTGPTDAGRQL
jgi:hypothetical protein